EPKIDGEVMAQPQQVGEAEIAASRAVGGAGEERQLALGRAGKDDPARCLAEIDRLAFLLDRAGLGREEMHQRLRFVGAVVLAKAGVQSGSIIAAAGQRWIPALAGMSWWLWQVRGRFSSTARLMARRPARGAETVPRTARRR